MSFGKRKHANDDNDDQYQPVPSKQLRLSIARGAEENDVAMNDVENLVNFVPFPSSYSPITEGSDSPSPSYSLSTLPSTSSHSSPAYPAFDLYPEPQVDVNMDVDAPSRPHFHQHFSSPESQPGLLQPSAGFLHHGENCTQIPRLRMSSHPGINGTRTLWSHCQSCGAIEMVKS
ncbi:hypothetical protein FRC03_006217 [Tulasnella sp. 419]|nr:hypothetical protein FRC03_006217 [Tulasnella sp. 419]